MLPPAAARPVLCDVLYIGELWQFDGHSDRWGYLGGGGRLLGSYCLYGSELGGGHVLLCVGEGVGWGVEDGWEGILNRSIWRKKREEEEEEEGVGHALDTTRWELYHDNLNSVPMLLREVIGSS